MDLTRTIGLAVGSVINLVVAEWAIRRSPRASQKMPPPMIGGGSLTPLHIVASIKIAR